MVTSYNTTFFIKEKIKSGLVFSKRSGNLVGFVDLGGANSDIERLVADPGSSQPQLSDQMLVLKAKVVLKLSLSCAYSTLPFP